MTILLNISSISLVIVIGICFILLVGIKQTNGYQHELQHDLQSASVNILMAQTDIHSEDTDLDRRLWHMLNQTGPDLKQLRDFKHLDSESGIDVQLAKRAWHLMRLHTKQAISNRLQLSEPIILEFIEQAGVSSKCFKAAKRTIKGAKDLESWAIQLFSAWGDFPPTGLFEGTFGSIGSFDGCLNVPDNDAIGHAHYCSLSYRPIVPTRKDYEILVRPEPDELINMFDDLKVNDAFGDLLKFAQYYHYVYIKYGTCFPIECSPFDIQLVAKMLGRRSILQTGPVKCFSKNTSDYESVINVSVGDQQFNSTSMIELKVMATKDLYNGVYVWKPHLTKAQWIASMALIATALCILSLTLLDLIGNQILRFSSSKQESSFHQINGLHIMNRLESETTSQNRIEEQKQEPKIENPNELYHEALVNIADPVGTCQRKNKSSLNRVKSSNSEKCLLMNIANDCSILRNFQRFISIESKDSDREIYCIHGIRCITMSWIILTHTMQYNEWSAFSKTRLVETHLMSLINQPLFNGSYLVDTFFLISGLLTSYITLKTSKIFTSIRGNQMLGGAGNYRKPKFSISLYILARYLRLTPQVLFTSLLFIVLPLAKSSGGPHWYAMTGEYSEFCSKNWWVNLLHIQAFYRSNEMCNYVSWWISVDMFYHLFALMLLLVTFRINSRFALRSCLTLILINIIIQFKRHYELSLPPNLLSTIPQAGAMWTQMTLEFFWSPIAHAFPFFWGFYVGYLMARDGNKIASRLNSKRAILIWSLVIGLLLTQSYSTYFWVIGRWHYNRLVASSFSILGSINWSLGVTWIILACKYGFGWKINDILSCNLFQILSRASYFVYLSHFIVLFVFFGSQNVLIEPSQLMMVYIIIGNICVSMLFGSILCIGFEMPWLNLQKRLMQMMR